MAISQRRLTLEEFLELPEDKPALEYVDGAVTQKVSPKGRHSGLQFGFAERVNHFARPRKLALAFPELRTTFGGRSPVPDVVVYRWDRLPVDADGNLLDDFVEPPDIAVEIRSPGQSVRTLVARCHWYAANGVQISLLVNPDDRSVLDVRPDGSVRTLPSGRTGST